jgi:hypothetical protein
LAVGEAYIYNLIVVQQSVKKRCNYVGLLTLQIVRRDKSEQYFESGSSGNCGVSLPP